MPGAPGYTDGAGSAARFNFPEKLAVDSAGNVYVADTGNGALRRITPSGVVTTLAGGSSSTDVPGSAQWFWRPYGVAVDGTGNVYAADAFNNTIVQVTPAGVVTTLAGLAGQSGSANGTGSAARFGFCTGVAVDSTGNVYVADTDNSTIRRITPAGGVTTLAGLAGSPGSADGTGSAARFSTPGGVAVGSTGNIYVADTHNCTIRRITPAGVVTTLAGSAGNGGSANGTGSEAQFYLPEGLAVDSAGNVYVADTDSFTVRRLTPAGVVTTLAGLAGISGSVDGTGSTARFHFPYGVAVDGAGNVYVADTWNNRISKGVPLTASGAPQILVQPQSQSVVAGTNAIFSVAANGSPTLSYQWWFNNSSLTGATNAALVLTNVQSAQAGNYFVVASNAYGSITSAPPATLSVALAALTLTWTNPAPIVYGAALSSIELSATASVPGSFAYTPTNGTVLNAGTNTPSVIFTPTDTVDYNSVTDSVNLIVSPAPLVVTAANASRVPGQTNPVFTGAIVGLTNGDNITAAYSCAATPASPAGNYTIVPSLVDPDQRLANYTVTLVNGFLTVGPSGTAGPSPLFTTLHSFTGGSDGEWPQAGLILSGDTLYGTVWGGGSSGGASGGGTVFSVRTDGTGFTALHDFTWGTDGAYPYDGLVLSGNTLYGTANEGRGGFAGTVFSLNTDGTVFRTLHGFTWGGDGALPWGGLILSGNTLYGTTLEGGVSDKGTVFSVNTDGTGFATLYSFSGGNDGSGPLAGLILSGNTLYGTAAYGGSSGKGTVFSVNTDGTGFTTLHSFSGGNDGAAPAAVLVLSGNTLYGTAEDGGSLGNGTVFSVNTDGTGFTTLHSFSGGSDGGQPRAGLIISGNTLYGTAYSGGSWGAGTVFSVNTDGTGFTTLHSFSGGNEGGSPWASLILSGNTLYGTTYYGGASGAGTVFSLRLSAQASPAITWPTPAPLTYGAALTAEQLNATASVPGSFAYTPTNGTVLNAGTDILSVIFTPTDTVDYSGVTGTVSLVVSPAPLVVTAANASRVYGQTNPLFTGVLLGLTNGENITAAYSCTATAASPAGNYPIVPSLVDPNHRLANYTVTLVNGTLTVLPPGSPLFTVLHTFTGGSDGARPTAGLILSGDTLYGTTLDGGSPSNGVVFSVSTNGTGFTSLHRFSGGSDGVWPWAGLVLSGNTLYGTTFEGGNSGAGTVFRVNTDGTGFASLHSFTFGGDGSFPLGELVLSGNTLYGTASTGGKSGVGTVFSLNTDGTGFAILYSFSGGSDGSQPHGGLVLYGNTLYGTTYNGGSFDDGAVFRINTDGTGFRTLYSFTGGSDGFLPNAGLVLSGNTLYGTALNGAISDNGTVFRVNTDGTGFTILHSFSGGGEGGVPYGGLILSGDILYGTAAYGGGSGDGTVFSLNTDGTGFTTLWSLNGARDGAYPQAGLTLSGTALYGTAYEGGSLGAGTVFGLQLPAPTNAVITWAAPAALTYGAALTAELLNATANVSGNFAYNPTNGTVPDAGTNTLSVIFTPADTVDYNSVTGTVSLVVSPAPLIVTAANASRAYGQTNPVFTGAIVGLTNGDNISAAYSCAATAGSPVGAYPIVPSLVDPNQRLANYTVTLVSGTLTVGVSSPAFTTLHTFTGGSDGAWPQAGLILSGDTLYGTANSGGSSTSGTVLSVNTDGTGFRTLYSFSGGSGGAYPAAGLILSGNVLYGTTVGGGSSGDGKVFSVNADGTGFTTLHSFTGVNDGAQPRAGLILSGNVLYGTANLGGSSEGGTVFSVHTDGTGFTNLYSLNGASDGAQPFGGLILSGSTLYGTAAYGGGSGNGTVFRVNSNGRGFTTLYSFSGGSDGAQPFGGLAVSGNALYGTAAYGGGSGQGTVFSVNTDGTGFTTLHSFSGGSDGANPEAALTLSGNTLYGTAAYGGGSGQGTVFRVNADGTGFATLWSLNGGSDGAYPQAGLVLSGDTLYGTAVGGGGLGDGTVFSLQLPAPTNTVITWATPAPLTYGAALTAEQLNATANVSGSFAYTPASGTVLNAGANALSVIFTPTDAVDYQSATDTVSLIVSPAPLVVSVASASRAYGQANPVFSGAITGLTNGDHITATYSCTATPASPAGAYPIEPSLVDPNGRLANYALAVIEGTLTVTAALGPPQSLVLAAGTNSGAPFSQVLVPVQVKGFSNILSFQFSLHWEAAAASFVDLEQFGLAGLGAGSFGTELTNAGTLTVSWDDPAGTGEALGDGTVLFAIRFAFSRQSRRGQSHHAGRHADDP